MFRDAGAYREIYSNRANVQKSGFYEAWRRDKWDINTFNVRDQKDHAMWRKRLNQSFTEKSLRAAEPFVTQHVDRWVALQTDGDGSQWSEPKNFADVSDTLIFDIMGDLCFGKSFDLKEPGDNPFKTIPHAVVQYMQFVYPVSVTFVLDQ